MADVKNINGYTIKDSTARSNIGTLNSLGTTDKTSLVAAINEVNTAVAGKQAAGDYKTTQTAKTDPSASGTTITAIATITQNANGEITVTKKNVQMVSASISGVGGQAGLMAAADKEKLDLLQECSDDDIDSIFA